MTYKSYYLMLLGLLLPLASSGQQKDLTKAPFECDLLKAYAEPIKDLNLKDAKNLRNFLNL